MAQAPYVPTRSPLPLLIGAGVLGGFLIWAVRSSTTPAASRLGAPPLNGPISIQTRPFPDLQNASPAVLWEYISKAQAQLNTLGYLPNLASITWGTMDDRTFQALQAFVQHDPALLARIHAAAQGPQTTMALDALDQAYRTALRV